LTAATVFAFYRYDKNRDVLTCENAFGDRHDVLEGLTIALGTRVSGWSAATRRISVNADASLDLNQIATRYSPSLRCTLSVPVVNGDALVGVFTAYANQPEAFQESDRYTFEQVVAEFHKQLLRSSHPRSVVPFPLHRQ
jgi:putative methionine-R-sulfoxide reductase with GAF domain